MSEIKKKQTFHPAYAEMISKAISTLNERTGSSVPAIVKFIQSNYKSTELIHIKTQLKRLALQGKLIRNKNSYKLSAELKLSIKKSETKKTEKAKPQKKSEKTEKKPEKTVKKSEKSKPAKKTAEKKPKKVIKRENKPKVVKNPTALAGVPAPVVDNSITSPRTPKTIKLVTSPRAKTPEKKKVVTPVKGSSKKTTPKRTSKPGTPKSQSKSSKKSPKSSGKKPIKGVTKKSKAITRK